MNLTFTESSIRGNKEELVRMAKRVAEIQWLLLVLVMLYVQLSRISIQEKPVILVALGCFALFVLISNYSRLRKVNNKWKLTVDTWAMLAFITMILWHTGKIESPLLTLYLFVIITAGITLGETTAFLEVGLISTLCLFLSFTPSALAKIKLVQLSGPLILMFPFWLTAYVTIKLSKEINLAKNKVEHLSQTDYLTGLYNMRIFLILINQELERSIRFRNSFSLMIIDADGFKNINDTFGHLAGDKLIKLFADTIKSNLRSTDIVARYGGDEFVVLLTQTSASNALVAGEHLKTKIEQTPFNVAGQNIQITASIGIAAYPDHGTVTKELLKRADDALLKSKGAGKNKITVFPG